MILKENFHKKVCETIFVDIASVVNILLVFDWLFSLKKSKEFLCILDAEIKISA